MEDYCHAVEHSIEFQVVFLQHRFGPGVKVVPVLCGPFARSLCQGGRPEDDPHVARFIDGLGELAARRGSGLRFVLGVDMAHVGRRYGDRQAARVGDEALEDVAARDRARLDCVAAGDAAGFWEHVVPDADRYLRWCGTSPLYTFLRAVPEARGRVLRYEQWNIDAQSVVTFAALAFGKAPGASD
jgi:MEMO1 family protein